MKQLVLFRHGKSSWNNPDVTDIDRPLLHKGRERTRKMAEYLVRIGLSTDMLMTSSAVRAYQSAEIVAEVLGIDTNKIFIEPDLYHASTERIWDVVISLPEDANSVILFGHNPGLTEFINISRISSIDWLPTSGVASATYKCKHWHDCIVTPPGKTFVLHPSNLR